MLSDTFFQIVTENEWIVLRDETDGIPDAHIFIDLMEIIHKFWE